MPPGDSERVTDGREVLRLSKWTRKGRPSPDSEEHAELGHTDHPWSIGDLLDATLGFEPSKPRNDRHSPVQPFRPRAAAQDAE
jgi:hypothetical protein